MFIQLESNFSWQDLLEQLASLEVETLQLHEKVKVSLEMSKLLSRLGYL